MTGIMDHRFLLGRRAFDFLLDAMDAELLEIETVEAWWEFPQALVFALLDAWKDYRFGRLNWTREARRDIRAVCDSHPNTGLIRRAFDKIVDATRYLTAPARTTLAAFGLGTQLLATIKKGKCP